MSAQRFTTLLARAYKSCIINPTLRFSTARWVRTLPPTITSIRYQHSKAFSTQTCKMAASKEWYEAYPDPRNQSPAAVSRQDLLQRLQNGQKSGIDFLLIDLRKVDQQVRTHPAILGTLHLFWHIKGWNYQGIIKPACSESLLFTPNSAEDLPARSYRVGDILLWLVVICQSPNVPIINLYLCRLVPASRQSGCWVVWWSDQGPSGDWRAKFHITWRCWWLGSRRRRLHTNDGRIWCPNLD